MGHWNHRVVKQRHPDLLSETGFTDYFGIHECFYDDDGTKPGWTTDPIAPVSESLEDLRETLERMLRALDKPVIIDTETGAKP